VESYKALSALNFGWMGWPITAYPQDMIAMRELTLKLKPFHINETGIPYCESNMY
jgi:cephalosporin hydroxylase